MERTYGSLVRHELGSSYSALDGVPFKIGRSFRLPEQVRPPHLLHTKTADVLSEQYTFEVEEAVLTWSKARDEAAQKAAEEQAQRLKEKEKLTAEASQSQATSGQNGDGLSNDTDPEEISVYDVPRYTIPQKKSDENQVKPPVPPKASSLLTPSVSGTGTVLTPIPIKPSVSPSVDKQVSSSAGSNSKIDSQLDLAMFEAEVDPFDNLELQALNDMEELKVLLNSSSVNVQCDSSNVHEVSSEKLVAMESSASLLISNAQSDSGENSISKPNSDCTSQLNEISLEETCDDGEYVEINPKYKNQSEIPQATTVVPSGLNSALSKGDKGNPVRVDNTPAVTMNNQIYKPVLPPIPKSEHFQQSSACYPESDSQPAAAKPEMAPCQAASPQMWNSSSQNPANGKETQSSKDINGREFASSSPPLSAHSAKPCRPAPPPPVSARPIPVPRTKTPHQSSDAMSSSAGPSLSKFLGNTSQPEVHMRSTPSPYSRHCNSTSDLILAGSPKNGSDGPRRNSAAVSPQPWNRHMPLPPPPTVNTNKPSFCPPAQPSGLSDPYSSLSKEEKAFTDSLTNMGFLRPMVARAVQKFGNKEKEVLDHLLAVNKLGEQSYAPLMIESALFTFKNDLEKASRFLQLQAQFEELGFQRDKIHDALVSTDLEHDKALDILTA